MTELLYMDPHVQIYRELIILNKYYFPLGTSKTIYIDDIETISLIDSEGVNHRWGVCGKYLNNWFNLDKKRG